MEFEDLPEIANKQEAIKNLSLFASSIAFLVQDAHNEQRYYEYWRDALEENQKLGEKVRELIAANKSAFKLLREHGIINQE